MGNFRQHLTCSTTVGVLIGGVSVYAGVPLPTALMAGGSCSLAGMLPDIDSKSSRAAQETLWGVSCMAALLCLSCVVEVNASQETAIVMAACAFLLCRYGLGWVIGRCSVHRGMFHSIPSAVIAGEIMFLLSTGPTEWRILKAAAVSAGFLSHLILDEVFSVDSAGNKFRIKNSFGTALKMMDFKNRRSTAITYTILVVVTCVVMNESYWVEQYQAGQENRLARWKKLADIFESPPTNPSGPADGSVTGHEVSPLTRMPYTSAPTSAPFAGHPVQSVGVGVPSSPYSSSSPQTPAEWRPKFWTDDLPSPKPQSQPTPYQTPIPTPQPVRNDVPPPVFSVPSSIFGP